MENSFLKVLDGVKIARTPDGGSERSYGNLEYHTDSNQDEEVGMGGQHGGHISVPTE